MLATDLPGLNAFLNTLSATFLGFGFYFVRRRQLRNHRIAMLLAIATSTLFLCSYVIYHVLVGSVPYPYQDWTRIIYFAILSEDTICANFLFVSAKRGFTDSEIAKKYAGT